MVAEPELELWLQEGGRRTSRSHHAEHKAVALQQRVDEQDIELAALRVSVLDLLDLFKASCPVVPWA